MSLGLAHWNTAEYWRYLWGETRKGIIAVYVEFFRGSPLFVQLFIAVYTVPAILNLRIDHYLLAFLVFGLNSAAYQKGYMKGAMQTILDDQMAAGMSVGMSKFQTLRHVILPQAYRIVIPSWTNEFCSLTKSTATLAFVGLFDLVAQAFQSGCDVSDSPGLDCHRSNLSCLDNWIFKDHGYNL